MSNMSYCRFENTVRDLNDCQRAIEEMLAGDGDALSDDELAAAKCLVETCSEIIGLVASQAGRQRLEVGLLGPCISLPIKHMINALLDKANEVLQ